MTERQRRRPWLYAICGTAIGLFVVGFVFVVTSTSQTTNAIRGSQQNNHALLAATREAQQNNHDLLTRIVKLSHRIDDCTKPAGKCFKDGQKRTAGAIVSIQRQSIATAACQVVLSQQPHTGSAADLFAQIDQCADETLAQLDSQHR